MEIQDFPGLPHRLQLIAEYNNVRYFNDSKCTTPDAAKLAVQAFMSPDQQHHVHLILGGYDKGSDFTELAAYVWVRCKAVYTIGAMGGLIAEAIEKHPASAEVIRCGELEKAVTEIEKRVKPGDVVLLSPACASWDQFENYEQRGERFIELVKKHISNEL